MLVFYRNHFQFDIDIDTMVCKKMLRFQDGWTALHYTAINGFIMCLEFLHKNGAKITVKDRLQRTALHWAC